MTTSTHPILGPVKLKPDNFTPPTRTPWGGERIRSFYKSGLSLAPGPATVGESWEVSVEPSFPSRCVRTGEPLSQLIAAAPIDWLGPAVAQRYGGQTPLLVKLLDSADNLSVQVHPADGDPELGPHESGKPESWIVVDAEPGAGFYLGFRNGVEREDVRRCLTQGGHVQELLNFVEVAPGDSFMIAAGTVHAIGAGVTLVEPQFVTPGRRGITYRFWDWNRRYDADGNRSPAGVGRPLHIERSMAVTTWDGPRGQSFVDQCRTTPVALGDGRERLVNWPWFEVQRWSGTRTFELRPGSMWAATCVGGTATLHSQASKLMLRRGESAAIPASARLEVSLREANLVVTRSRD